MSLWTPSFYFSFSAVSLQPQLEGLIPPFLFWTSCGISPRCRRGWHGTAAAGGWPSGHRKSCVPRRAWVSSLLPPAFPLSHFLLSSLLASLFISFLSLPFSVHKESQIKRPAGPRKYNDRLQGELGSVCLIYRVLYVQLTARWGDLKPFQEKLEACFSYWGRILKC